MKYYVVSEEELTKTVADAIRFGQGATPHRKEELDKAEAACRAREVPEWATHFCDIDKFGRPDDFEEIKR